MTDDKRQPWMKFYTRDWRSNVKLRMCSYAARGLWIDALTLMSEAPVFGFLMVNDVVPNARQLAGLLGGTDKEIEKLLAELGEASVYSVTGQAMPADVRALIPPTMPDGVIFSRRMVRDREKAEKARLNGKGGGNPKLTPRVIPKLQKMREVVNLSGTVSAQGDNLGVNPQANPQSQSQNPESFSSGISTDAARVAALTLAGSAPRAQRQTTAQRMAEIAARKRALT